MNESHGSFELLSSRVDELEKRVHALEHPDEVRAVANNAIGLASAGPPLESDSLQTANIFPIFGRAMLGIAGAYVLRAVAEAGVMPKIVVATVAIVYAFAWLVWAARISKARGIAPHIYAGTSAVILVPMLWEITLHFHVLTPIVTAGVLAAYVTLAVVIGTGDGCAQFAWIAQSLGVIATVALAVATHHVLPFLVTLLLALLVVEYARALNYRQPAWPLIALVTDGAIWGMIFIYSGPQNARGEYSDLSIAALVFPACLLFAINGSSAAVRTIAQQKKIGIFDAIQATIGFLLLVSSVLFFVPQNGSVAIGILCLVLSTAVYAASFLRLRQHAELRSFYVFVTWSAALLVAGALWTLPASAAGIALAIAGLAAYIFAARLDLRILELQGTVFLCTAVIISGIAQYVFGALAGSLPGTPAIAVWLVACSAVGAYVAGRDAKDDGWARQLLHLVPALLAVSAVSALLVHGVLKSATLAIALGPHHIAFLRTLAISAVSLCLAYVGPRWGRVAITRLAYVALAFVAAKLLFEDLRHGHLEFIAGSIFLFAMTLIAVPRLVRLAAKSRAEVHSETPVHIGS
jgi:hypothetical protein